MVKMKMKIGGEWAEFSFSYVTIKTTQEILQRMPKNKRTPAMFLHHVVTDPQLTLFEWQNEVPMLIVNKVFEGITEIMKVHKGNQQKLNCIIDEIDELPYKYATRPDLFDKNLERLVKKRDKLIEKIKKIEEDDGIVMFY